MKKISAFLSMFTVTLMGLAAVAMAQDPTAETVVTDAASTLSSQLLVIAAAVVPAAIAIYAVSLGLKLAMGMFRSASNKG